MLRPPIDINLVAISTNDVAELVDSTLFGLGVGLSMEERDFLSHC